MKRNVLEYLEADVLLHPEKIAVEDEQTCLRYDELLDSSRRIGSGLAAVSGMRMPIAVMAEKSVFTEAVFLGIVQAGCYYVLLNPELPAVRLCQIQEVLNAEWLITDAEHYEKALALMPAEKILMMEDLIKTPVNQEVLTGIRSRMVDTDPLYANFTSGSTGVPKGVLVSHRSVLDFIDCFSELFGIGAEDIIGNQAPFDFDVSVKDIYTALKTGAKLVIIPRHLFSVPAKLLDYICERNVTTMIWAVSALCLISTFHGLDYRVPTSVRRILFSGETMPQKALDTWMGHLPETEFVNLYGPTEITCNCTYHRIDRNRDYADGIPIGTAFPNEEVFLLDKEGKQVVMPGKTGEICVRGSALALGYLNNPEQTARAFVQNPLNQNYPDRIYRTGDLAFYTPEQELMFCGRKDFQIKYMGHRIEIEEIERAVSNLDGVERCCVVFDEKKQRLFGFYMGTIDKKKLHAELKTVLPVYMIPGVFYVVSAFPLTKNGKVDRKALMEMRKKR